MAWKEYKKEWREYFTPVVNMKKHEVSNVCKQIENGSISIYNVIFEPSVRSRRYF